MSKLVICEKPSVAKSITSALGVTSRADGYFEGGGWLISAAAGIATLERVEVLAGLTPGAKVCLEDPTRKKVEKDEDN